LFAVTPVKLPFVVFHWHAYPKKRPVE